MSDRDKLRHDLLMILRNYLVGDSILVARDKGRIDAMVKDSLDLMDKEMEKAFFRGWYAGLEMLEFKIEEAKKQEGDRIFKEIEKYRYQGHKPSPREQPQSGYFISDEEYQALKLGGRG